MGDWQQEDDSRCEAALRSYQVAKPMQVGEMAGTL